MKKAAIHIIRFNCRSVLLLTAILAFIGLGSMVGSTAWADAPAQMSSFRMGEKLTYQVSLGRFSDAGFLELQVASRGKMGGKDVVELRSRTKTLEIVSATFLYLDENRTVYAAPDTGLPLYIVKTNHEGPLPKETISNYLTQPTQNFDLITLLYKARESAGNGTFSFTENERVYTASFVAAGAERVRTNAGEFETIVSSVTSDFLIENGIKDLRINFSADDARLPVAIRFKTPRGEVRAILSAIAMPEEPTPSPTASAVPVRTPTPAPRRTPTPDPYVDNLPLAAELGFQLGEQLEYRVSTGGRPVGTIVLAAKERKQFQREDSLLLTATVTAVSEGTRVFNVGDGIKVQVNPETLSPRSSESKFPLLPAPLNQTAVFDSKDGGIRVGPTRVDGPIGTHTILSLIYAMRSFNLKPSRTRTNPVNDTRVAVFWESKTHVFTLRPSEPAEITLNGQKMSAQLITVSTGNPQLDVLQLKVWLSTEERVPVRFSIGPYQVELVSQTTSFSRS